MVSVLTELNREAGLTILLIEHVMRAVMALAARVLVLHHGAAIAERAPEAVLREPAGGQSYLSAEAVDGCCATAIPTILTATRRRSTACRSRSARGRSLPSSGRTEPARPPSFAPSPACTIRRVDASSSAISRSVGGKAIGSAISASAKWRKA